MRREYDRLFKQWLLRRTRLRRLLRPLPRRSNLHRYPVIKWFAERARRHPFLWSFKRAQVIPALYVGSLISLAPVYGIQILLAFAAALIFRANLSVMVALQFLTNPLTVVPIYAATGWIGTTLMRYLGVGSELPTALFYTNALFIGGVVVGLLFAFAADMTWRGLAWEARRFKLRLQRVRHQADTAEASAAQEAADQQPH